MIPSPPYYTSKLKSQTWAKKKLRQTLIPRQETQEQMSGTGPSKHTGLGGKDRVAACSLGEGCPEEAMPSPHTLLLRTRGKQGLETSSHPLAKTTNVCTSETESVILT